MKSTSVNILVSTDEATLDDRYIQLIEQGLQYYGACVVLRAFMKRQGGMLGDLRKVCLVCRLNPKIVDDTISRCVDLGIFQRLNGKVFCKDVLREVIVFEKKRLVFEKSRKFASEDSVNALASHISDLEKTLIDVDIDIDNDVDKDVDIDVKDQGSRIKDNGSRITDPGSRITDQGREEKPKRQSSKRPLPQLPQELSSPECVRAWEDWQEHRRELRKPITALTAEKTFRRYVLSPADFARDIEHSISQGWHGIYAPKELSPPPNGRPKNLTTLEINRERLEAIRRRDAERAREAGRS